MSASGDERTHRTVVWNGRNGAQSGRRVERFTITERGKTLEVSVTVDDLGAFNTPWSARQVYRLEYQGLFDEAPCADNNDVSLFRFDLMPIPKSDRPDF